MKQLETQVKSKGFVFEILERTEFAAIQSQKCQDSGRLVAYEVFRINKNEERQISGVKIAASESRPSNEQFGTSAWCYSLSGTTQEQAYARAMQAYRELCARIEKQMEEKQNQAA